jgi:hypothetical protein
MVGTRVAAYMQIVEVNLLVICDEANLGSLWYPALRLTVLIQLLFITTVQGSKNALTESFNKALVESLLGDVDEEEPSQANRLLCPIFLRYNELDGAAMEFWSLISINADALRARGAEVLRWRVVGICAEVADKLISARSKHHERVDVGAASAAARRASFAKVEDWDLCLSRLQGSQRLQQHAQRQSRGLKPISGGGKVVQRQACEFRRGIALIVGDKGDGRRRRHVSFERRVDILEEVLLDGVSSGRHAWQVVSGELRLP